jgi:hypothetical protein
VRTSVLAFDNDDSIVRWRSIVGVITVPVVDNLWEAFTAERDLGPFAAVVLASTSLQDMLPSKLRAGARRRNCSGTPGPVSAVTGTLMCNAGSQTQAILDTSLVPLNVHGDARFSGHLQNLPVTCANPCPRPDRDSGRRCRPLDCDGNWAFHRRRRKVNIGLLSERRGPADLAFFMCPWEQGRRRSTSAVFVTKIGPKASPQGHAFGRSFVYSRDYARSIRSSTRTRKQAGRGQIRRLG